MKLILSSLDSLSSGVQPAHKGKSWESTPAPSTNPQAVLAHRSTRSAWDGNNDFKTPCVFEGQHWLFHFFFCTPVLSVHFEAGWANPEHPSHLPYRVFPSSCLSLFLILLALPSPFHFHFWRVLMQVGCDAFTPVSVGNTARRQLPVLPWLCPPSLPGLVAMIFSLFRSATLGWPLGGYSFIFWIFGKFIFVLWREVPHQLFSPILLPPHVGFVYEVHSLLFKRQRHGAARLLPEEKAGQQLSLGEEPAPKRSRQVHSWWRRQGSEESKERGKQADRKGKQSRTREGVTW